MDGVGEGGEEFEVEAEGGDVLAEVEDGEAGCWVYYFWDRGQWCVGDSVFCG